MINAFFKVLGISIRLGGIYLIGFTLSGCTQYVDKVFYKAYDYDGSVYSWSSPGRYNEPTLVNKGDHHELKIRLWNVAATIDGKSAPERFAMFLDASCEKGNYLQIDLSDIGIGYSYGGHSYSYTPIEYSNSEQYKSAHHLQNISCDGPNKPNRYRILFDVSSKSMPDEIHLSFRSVYVNSKPVYLPPVHYKISSATVGKSTAPF